ncbi:MAG: hypothetical protein J6L05_02505, partial [Ruminococcus sp.]|nr:hypothetical protein [Ruminococcus sp.]
MKSFYTRLISALTSIITAIVFLASPVYAAESLKSTSTRMTWYLSPVTCAPGDDIRIDVTGYNQVGLSRLQGVGIKVAAPIQITGMSDYCNTYNASINYTINNNQIDFTLSGSNPSAGADGSVLFSVYCHVPAGCPAGTYEIGWDAEYWYAETGSGSPYFGLVRRSTITVTNSPSTGTTPTTTTSTTTTTTTT